MNLIAAETSDKIRFGNIPYIDLRVKGYSYINAKAASLLNFQHQDVLMFYFTDDLTEWFIANDPLKGAVVNKDSGLFKFSDAKNVRRFFQSLNLDAKKARFNLATKVQNHNGLDILFINPKPYNIEK